MSSTDKALRLLSHLSVTLPMVTMDTIAETRLANLQTLVNELGTLDAVAAKVGSSSVYFSQVRKRAIDRKTGRPREMGTPMARRIEEAFDKPRGWMDQHHPKLRNSPSPAPAGVPPSHRVTERRMRHWPFSDALFADIEARPLADVHRLENVMRAHLDMPLLPAMANERWA